MRARNVSDIRLASENAVFGQPEVGLGITPGFGGTQRLARLIPVGIAKEMIFTGRNIKVDRAYEIGLVNAVYPADQLMEAAQKMAKGIAKNAPIAVEKAKKRSMPVYKEASTMESKKKSKIFPLASLAKTKRMEWTAS